jgi:uncharacterized protein
LRRCVACRMLRPRDVLLRITYSLSLHAFSINDSPPLQGRSAYLCKEEACIEATRKGKKIQKALKRAIPDAILSCLLKG